MNRILCFILLGIALPCCVNAQSLNALSEAEQLGMTAGLAMACGSGKKLEDFELIAARLLANPSASEEIEKQQLGVYVRAKWEALTRQKRDLSNCKEVLEHFDRLPLFNSIVYS